MAVRIKLLEKPEIRDAAGELRRIRGHKPWAPLARVLTAERPISRQQLAGELFPDADDPLGSLRWSLAELRRALGSAEPLTGDPVATNLPRGAAVDVHALARGTLDTIDDVGPFLEGIEPQSGPEFESWLLIERERTASLVDAQLRQEVLRALSHQDGFVAVALRLLELSA